MRPTSFLASLPLLPLLFLALGACGSSSNGTTAADSGATDDGGADAGRDTGAADDAASAGDAHPEAEAGPAFPAFTVDAPQIAKNQGVVLAQPILVTISWPGDADAATWEAMGDALGASSYWAAATAEYGVGKATSGAANHVRMNAALPAKISYTDLDTFVSAHVQATQPDAGAPEAGASDGGPPDPAWPAPVLDAHGTAQTIYSLFIPSSTAVTDPGSGASFCAYNSNGYHASVTVGGVTVAYSVVLECPNQTAAGTEEAASHELIEAATDPFGMPTQGYVGFDADHLAWDLYTSYSDELADACESWQTSYYQETGSLPYWVQRSWSNKAALAGHDPCVPAPAGAYHGMTLIPSEETTVAVNLSSVGGTSAMAKGFKATVGQALTFHVGFFSDAPTAPFTIGYDFPSTVPINFGNYANGAATVTLSKTSGQNGDEATVTVTPSAKGAGGFQLMAITWDKPAAGATYPSPRYLPILLVDN